MLEVHDLTMSFGTRTIFSGVSLTVAEAEVVALLGPSGVGKTSLLRAIAGLVHADHGQILLGGTDISSLPTHRRSIGMVFQDDQLFPHRSVGENVEFGLRMLHWPRAQRVERVHDMLELVGLAGFEDRRVPDLSGGEAKRVALVRTLATSPRVVLLDEPLTGLDRDLHDQLATELAALLRSTRTTALLVTHDRDEATTIAHRTLTLSASGPCLNLSE